MVLSESATLSPSARYDYRNSAGWGKLVMGRQARNAMSVDAVGLDSEQISAIRK
jgi:hypothetical protein